MATTWNFKPETPDTEDVYAAYLNWHDPAYGNPEAQAAWEKVNREEFDAWLDVIKREAYWKGYSEGGDDHAYNQRALDEEE